MTREFSDELLSALLDGELSEAERITVERHLAANPADRQLFEDLKALRGEVASLPQPPVSPDFADRVVQAALAEAEKQNEARGLVSRAPPVERHFWRRWKYGAAAASAAALAACLLLVVLVRRQQDEPRPGGDAVVTASGGRQPTEVDPRQAVATVMALPDQLVSALSAAAPRGRDAIVLRLKVGQDMPIGEALDAALAKAGVGVLASDAAASATLIEQAYQRSFGSTESNAATPADVIFIEAPLKSVQDALANLASTFQDPLQIEPSGKLGLRRGDDEAEGEGSVPAKPYAQHLSGSAFPLTAKPTQPPTPATRATLNPQQPVRILILVEAQ